MKKRVFVLMLASLLLCACVSDKEQVITESSLENKENKESIITESTENEDNSNECEEIVIDNEENYDDPEPGSIVLILPSEDEISEAFRKILYENGPFFFAYSVLTDEGSYLEKSVETIESCCYTNWITTQTSEGVEPLDKWLVYWDKYTVLDLDGDGKDELIYELSPGMSAMFLIFHEEEEGVVAYPRDYRAMLKLTADGRISGSSGADDTDIYRIIGFDGDGIVEEEILCCVDEKYFLEGKEIEVAKAEQYYNEFFEASEVDWKEGER